jgi:surface carbohydrate biosynthesis protein
MEQKRILIDVSNILRDGFGLCYLKILLENEGYDVKIVDGSKDTFFTLFKFKPHLIVLGQVIEIKGSCLAKYAKSMGCKVVVLPTEGSVYPKKNEGAKKFLKTKYTKDYNEAVDLWLSWGKGYGDALIKYVNVDPEKVKVCGCPRFDIYKKPLSNVLMSKREFCDEYKIDPKKKIVTLSTHFVLADLDLKHAKNNVMYVENYDYMVKRKKQEERQRATILKNFLKLAKDLPHVNFILKLHPWEDGEYYIKRVKNSGIKNIKIIKKEYIANVIKNSDVWLHVNCTTAKEAIFMGKPVITLNFIEDYVSDFDEFSLMCDVVESYKDMLKKVKYYLRGGKFRVKNEMKKYIEERYFRIDGKSTKRCVNALKEFMDQHEIKPKRRIPFRLIPNMVRYDLRAILRYVIYSNKTLRNMYLRLRWKKSEEYLKFIETEIYEENFEKSINRIINKIKVAV